MEGKAGFVAIFEAKQRGLGAGGALLWPFVWKWLPEAGSPLCGEGGKVHRVGTLRIFIADEFLDVLPVFFSVGSRSVVLLLINIHHLELWPTAGSLPHFP